MFRSATAALLCLSLMACSERAPEPDPQPPEEPTGVPEAEPTNSIFDPEASVEATEEVLEPLVETISFAKGGDELDAAAMQTLKSVLSSDQLAEGGAVIVRGHSGAGGSNAVNDRISRERGEAVRDYLVANGVAKNRIKVIAFGAQNPIEPNANPDGTPNEKGREANRRVELTVLLPVTLPKAAETPQAAATPPA